MTYRQKILESAAKIFGMHNFPNASMDDIAAAANVSKGTLYYHFTGKADIYRELVHEGLVQLLEALKTQTAAKDAKDQMRALFSTTLSYTLMFPPLMSVFMGEDESIGDEEIHADIRRQREEFVRFIVGKFEQMIAAGEMRALPNVKLAVVGVMGIVRGLCGALSPMNEKKVDQVVDTTVDLLFTGLGA